MSSKSSITEALGNNDTNATYDINNKKTSRNYCFTFNNWNKHIESPEIFENFFKNSNKICKYIFKCEIGEKTKTKHIQGYLNLNKGYKIIELIKMFDPYKIHFSQCKGTEEQNVKYCSKTETTDIDFPKIYSKNIKIKIIPKIDIIKKENFRPFQSEIFDMILKDPDDRTIVWIYDQDGGKGKTKFLKYMIHEHKILFTNGGKKNDLLNYIFNNKNYFEEVEIPIIIWDLPRSVSNEYISYDSIENIKDGIICNNKFECNSFIIPNIHLIIFANKLPVLDKLSLDRWKIFTINEEYELKPYEIYSLNE